VPIYSTILVLRHSAHHRNKLRHFDSMFPIPVSPITRYLRISTQHSKIVTQFLKTNLFMLNCLCCITSGTTSTIIITSRVKRIGRQSQHHFRYPPLIEYSLRVLNVKWNYFVIRNRLNLDTVPCQKLRSWWITRQVLCPILLGDCTVWRWRIQTWRYQFDCKFTLSRFKWTLDR
jgi:hypothetical protein